MMTSFSICLSFGGQNSKALTSTSSSFFTKSCQRSQSFNVSCNNVSGEHERNIQANLDRRDVLLGLGGLYGAANLEPLAFASSIPPPDLKSCSRATISMGPEVPYSCCPRKPEDLDNIPYYKLLPMSKLRKRPAAQDVDEEYIAKYQLATKKMKELDDNDPLGFKQQANIHCAYCNDAYKIGDKVLQVHQSWLFFPFHRWYLYFYERILGKLIDDPTFALPYWNWDHTKGMRLPPMFDREGTSLYDKRRNPHVRNGTIIDLCSFGDEVKTTELQTMTNNLTLMYRQMITNAPSPLQFFGARYVLGTDPKGQGTIENVPHTPVHIWTGTLRGPNNFDNGATSYGEDMGNFYSAGLDPVFFCHHANVDRMWNIWKQLGGKRRDLSDKDWLNSEFFFYDENRNPYRVRVLDCLDNKKMGYDYEPMPTPWLNFKPTRKSSQVGKVMDSNSIKPASKVFPLAKLDRAISFTVNRPSNTQQEKIEKDEVLIFKGIKHDNSKYIRFDVFVNAEETVNADELDMIEFAGSYVSMAPLVHAHKMDSDELFQVAITELLEENGLEDDDNIAVTLVPKKGGQVLSIQSVHIEFV